MRSLARILALGTIAALALGGIPAARADIAVLTNGRTLKVTDYRASGSVMRLVLAAGGSVELPIDRVERIVDDEVVPAQEVDAAVAMSMFPDRSWRYDAGSGPLFSSRYNEVIVAAAKKFDVDAALVSAVIKAESDYDPRIVSRKGARGLMQLMPATARRFGVSDSFDPVANIYAGTRYLKWLLTTFDGKVDLAVAAYNAGEGNVWKYKGVPPFRETVEYLRRISRHLRSAEDSTRTAALSNDAPPSSIASGRTGSD
ncbi:MAG: lytic transglycosylase domain-containing protein [Thermoanaerobaculia bacterium]